MSNLTLRGNPAGAGTFTLESPNSANSRTITLPDANTTLVGTDATQTLTNKTIQGGALTLATAQASTSGTSIDFTGIPSWARRVTVMFNNVSLSGTSSILVQLGTSGGYVSTGYDACSYLFEGGSNAAVPSTAGFPVCLQSASRVVAGGAMVIQTFSSNIWIASLGGGASPSSRAFAGGGNISLGGTLDRIRITTVNGTDTFDSGSINIMYEG